MSGVFKLWWVGVLCWLAMIAPADADFCHQVDEHQICILSIKRSAKNYWQYQAMVSLDGVNQPSASYDCRERWIVDRDGKITLFRSRIDGSIVCSLYRS